MTKDLEETLAELGPGYREVVNRLVSEFERYEGFEGFERFERFEGLATSIKQSNNQTIKQFSLGRIAAYLVAASILVFLGLGIFFRAPDETDRGRSPSAPRLVYTAAYAPDETALASILSSQRPDGSWANDFITRQNAAALRNAEGAEMRVAYKKAVRYLKSRGLRPLSDDELKARGDEAARILATI